MITLSKSHNADSLDQRSLQHQGTYALSMALQFGMISLTIKMNDAVFFAVPGKLIHYTGRLALPLVILVTIFLFSVIWIGVSAGRFRRGIAAGFCHLRDRNRNLLCPVARYVVDDDGGRGLANAAVRNHLR